jgi:outer membrane protein TolC
VGLNNSTDRLEEILQNMSDRQTISLGFTVPLTAAGNRQINREIAQEQLFQEMTDIEVERREITRTVTQDVATYQLLNKNIALNERAMKVAQEILDLSRRQYLSGSISFTELNVLTIERDQALLEYYRSILQANLKYHEIRRNCLYDFKNREKFSACGVMLKKTGNCFIFLHSTPRPQPPKPPHPGCPTPQFAD